MRSRRGSSLTIAAIAIIGVVGTPAVAGRSTSAFTYPLGSISTGGGIFLLDPELQACLGPSASSIHWETGGAFHANFAGSNIHTWWNLQITLTVRAQDGSVLMSGSTPFADRGVTPYSPASGELVMPVPLDVTLTGVNGESLQLHLDNYNYVLWSDAYILGAVGVVQSITCPAPN